MPATTKTRKNTPKEKADEAHRREANAAIVMAVDPSPKNFCYWIGSMRTDAGGSDKCKIKDLAFAKFSLPDKNRDEEMQARLVEGEPLLDVATHIDIELQNPTANMPSWMAEKLGMKKGRKFAGNIVSHALSKSLESSIRARRAALQLPMPSIRIVRPTSKFDTFGLKCPSQKKDRKKLSARFIQEFFNLHSDDPSYDKWRRVYETEFIDEIKGYQKLDDAGDARMAGLARFVRINAGQK